MDGSLNIRNLNKQQKVMDLVSFLEEDTKDIITMITEEANVIGAMGNLSKHILYSQMKVSNGGESIVAKDPLLSYLVTEYWARFGMDAFRWYFGFGLCVYRILKRDIKVNQFEIAQQEGTSDEKKELTPTIEDVKKGYISQPVPICPSFNVLSRVRMFVKDDQPGAFVMDEKLERVDPNLLVYLFKTPYIERNKYNSSCSALLKEFRALDFQRKLYQKVATDNGFPWAWLVPVQTKGHAANDPVDQLNEHDYGQVILSENPMDNKLYLKPANTEVKPADNVTEANIQFQLLNYMHNGVHPEKKDSLMRIPNGFTVAPVTASTYLGNVNQQSELLDQRIASECEIAIGYVRPSIGSKQTAVVTADDESHLAEASKRHSVEIARFIKHVWCMDAYENYQLASLMMDIPVSNVMAMEHINMMLEKGYITHDSAMNKALDTKHINVEDEHKKHGAGKEPIDPKVQQSLMQQAKNQKKKSSNKQRNSKLRELEEKIKKMEEDAAAAAAKKKKKKKRPAGDGDKKKEDDDKKKDKKDVKTKKDDKPKKKKQKV